MKLELEPGVYVAAVSGGVDSVVLLHILKDLPGVELVVAHFDHGIRQESAQDRQFVEELAHKYGLPFEYAEEKLGAHASEETARRSRYEFLHQVMQLHNARAIVTAHHQDDVLETAILNLLRGTGRKGLTSLENRQHIIRPLLHMSKQVIRDYARQHNLQWQEDVTNQDPKYLRNYIRLNIVPNLGDAAKQKLQSIIEGSRQLNAELDLAIEGLLPEGDTFRRQDFIMLPHSLACEVMASWLRRHGIAEFNRKTIERLVVAAKVGGPNTAVDIYGTNQLRINQDSVIIHSSKHSQTPG